VTVRVGLFLCLGAALTACGPKYSPDTYAVSAVQQANKVDKGVIIGVREVAVSASGATGAVTGGAAGGITGSQVGTGAVSALSALGGTLIGGLAGSAAEKIAADTQAYEYIVRKPNGDLISVTQKDQTPLKVGQTVLVIAGSQARIVPDYTVDGIAGAATTTPVERSALPAEAPAAPATQDASVAATE